MDVGGGLAFSDTVTGLSLDVRVRTLVVHQAEGFSERGMSLSLGWGPDAVEPAGPDRAGGPVVGRAGAGRGRVAVGQPDGLRHGLAPDVRLRRAAQRGGGLRAAGGRRFVGTPKVGLTSSTYGRDYRFGYGLGVLEQGRVNFELAAEAQRRHTPRHGGWLRPAGRQPARRHAARRRAHIGVRARLPRRVRRRGSRRGPAAAAARHRSRASGHSGLRLPRRVRRRGRRRPAGPRSGQRRVVEVADLRRRGGPVNTPRPRGARPGERELRAGDGRAAPGAPDAGRRPAGRPWAGEAVPGRKTVGPDSGRRAGWGQSRPLRDRAPERQLSRATATGGAESHVTRLAEKRTLWAKGTGSGHAVRTRSSRVSRCLRGRVWSRSEPPFPLGAASFFSRVRAFAVPRNLPRVCPVRRHGPPRGRGRRPCSSALPTPPRSAGAADPPRSGRAGAGARGVLRPSLAAGHGTCGAGRGPQRRDLELV